MNTENGQQQPTPNTRQQQTDALARYAFKVLDGLDVVLADGQAWAAQSAAEAAARPAPLAEQYHQGRTAGYAEARQALASTRRLLEPIRTREENATAFAETIINAPTTTTGGTK